MNAITAQQNTQTSERRQNIILYSPFFVILVRLYLNCLLHFAKVFINPPLFFILEINISQVQNSRS